MANSSVSSYIRRVHHLIEQCIIFNMSKEECMEALSKHADIKPAITSTVWKELEKEDTEFFEAYRKQREQKDNQTLTRQRIHHLLSASSSSDADDWP